MLHKQPAMRKKPSILGAGLVCLDIIRGVGRYRYLNGGSCGNVVSGLSFLGWRGAVITGSYSDTAGKILHDNLSRINVNQLATNKVPTKTPRIIENLTVDGDLYVGHDYTTECPECSQKLPAWKPLTTNSLKPILNIISDYDVLYADRSAEGIKMLRAAFQKTGRWIVYEPNSARNIKSFYNNSCQSHIVKFSGDRIPQSIADELRKQAKNSLTTLIVRTVGKNGLFYSYRKKDHKLSDWFYLSSQPTSRFIDASGAGDWCTTGLLYGLVGKYRQARTWLSREDVIAALQYGQALAAISCSFIGAQGLFYAEVNDDRVKQLLKKRKGKIIQPASISISRDECPVCLQPLS